MQYYIRRFYSLKLYQIKVRFILISFVALQRPCTSSLDARIHDTEEQLQLLGILLFQHNTESTKVYFSDFLWLKFNQNAIAFKKKKKLQLLFILYYNILINGAVLVDSSAAR